MKNGVRICFITDTVFTLGGIQRVTSVLCSELSKSSDIDILCIDGSADINRKLYGLSDRINIKFESKLFKRFFLLKGFYKLLRLINIKTGIFNHDKLEWLLKEIYYPRIVQENFVKYINSQNYDIVIGVAGYYSLLLGIIQNNLNCNTIGWQHNSYDAYFKNKGRYHWNEDILFRKYLPKLDKYLVLSEYDKKMLYEQMNIKSKVMYNPKSFSSSDKSSLSKKTFLSAGRFIHQKGFDLLVESFYEFSKRDSDWNLIIIGEGEERDNIIKRIDEYNLAHRIQVKDFTDNIKQYFLDTSILLLPSRWEGMPMIVLESLEMGVPVISYNITAVDALVENEVHGLVVEAFDTTAFADAMYKLSRSLDYRRKLSLNALEKSKLFDIKGITKDWCSVLREVNDDY